MPRRITKYEQIYEYIRDRIIFGEFVVGDRLPSDAMLVKQFHASRPTVCKAMHDLERDGYLERRTGSGSYVRVQSAALPSLIGILTPEIGDAELFVPVCREIEHQCKKRNLTLLRTAWSRDEVSDAERERQALQLCNDFIQKRVKGVFFAPVEFSEHMKQVNRDIVRRLDEAGISIVLLDRDLEHLPDRSPYDLVGVDNFRVGMMQTNHFIAMGEKRIAYLSRGSSAPTIDLRIAGYRHALDKCDRDVAPAMVLFVAPDSTEAVQKINKLAATAIVCSNDATAVMLMRSLQAAKIRIPQDIKLIGVDDVKIAANAPVPLTTVRQPFREIGAMAAEQMVRRIEHRLREACTVSLSVELIIRDSCGSK